jgi:hypothetical protein
MKSSLSRLVLAFFALCVLFAGVSAVVDSCGKPAKPALPQISDSAKDLITGIGKFKKSATAGLKKLDHSFWPAVSNSLDPKVKAFIEGAHPIAKRASTPVDMVEVEIRGKITKNVINAVKKWGTVTFSSTKFGSITAKLPVQNLLEISNMAEVKSISPPAAHKVNKINTTGAYISERVKNLVQAKPNLTGTGIKIGILSDSIDLEVIGQSTGDLPKNIFILQGAKGWGLSEGAAMAELIYDIAPNATIFFATAVGSEATYATNILNLAGVGCQVIVDNLYYFQEPVFEDGAVALAVRTVTEQGVLYFSAAGNEGNKFFGTSSTYEADYDPVVWQSSKSTFLTSDYLDVHAFSPTKAYNSITGLPGFITLHWSDTFFEAFADYDLFVLDQNGNLVTFAATSSIAFEFISTNGLKAGKYRIVVARFFGPERALSLRIYGADSIEFTTNGFIFGHAAVATAFAVGAIHDVSPNTYVNLKQQVGTLTPEPYTSDGPRKIMYQNGYPVTPEDVSLATGGLTRQKPDVLGADCVATVLTNFKVFCGTSASAAHVAAIAALAVQAAGPGKLNPTNFRTFLPHGTVDVLTNGYDNTAGYGVLDAVLLTNYVLAHT